MTKAKLSWDKALVAGFLAAPIAAEDVAGKVLAIFFPIMAFVAMGFDHVVANTAGRR